LPELTGPATIACPFCQAHITIKVKQAAPPPAMVVQPQMAVARAMPVDDEDDEDEDEDEDYRPKKKKKKKGVSTAANETGMKVAIVGGILLLTLLSIVFAFWWFMRGDGKPNIIIPSKINDKLGQITDPDDGPELADATGSEKFEIPDKQLINQEFTRTFNPTSKLPGLEFSSVKDNAESLPSDVLNKVKNATVFIKTESARGGGTGSGFFACERGLVVTNAHVIDMLEEGNKEPESCRVYVNRGGSNQKDYKVISYKVDRKNDLALLRLADYSKSEYPDPLPLASSKTTRETQKVFSLGYPFGDSAGKEVTVTSLAVSSLRYKDGQINVVQFAGAMNPGNSGGPVIDASGRIVSVAVRIMTGNMGGGTLTNTGISMGVPSDEVAALYYGRADRLDVYPPRRSGDRLELPLVMRLTEHSSKTAAPKVKIQTGDEKTVPPNPDGSSDAVALKATDTKQLYTGSVDLPELAEGKVYWIHPQLNYGNDRSGWLEPMSYKPGKILDNKELPASSVGSATLGSLLLKQRYQWTVNTSRGSLGVRLDYESTTLGGKEVLKDTLKVGARINEQALPHQSLLQRFWTNRRDENESFSLPLKLPNVLRDNLNGWHDLAQLNIPRDTLTVGKSWKLPPRPVTIDYLFGFDAEQQCTLQCEYLGSYGDGSKLIGVIRILGDVVDPSTKNVSYGKLSGLALVDGTTRQLLDFMIRCDARKRTTGSSTVEANSSIEGGMQLRLQSKDL
jgi:hypothetical protein